MKNKKQMHLYFYEHILSESIEHYERMITCVLDSDQERFDIKTYITSNKFYCDIYELLEGEIEETWIADFCKVCINVPSSDIDSIKCCNLCIISIFYKPCDTWFWNYLFKNFKNKNKWLFYAELIQDALENIYFELIGKEYE